MKRCIHLLHIRKTGGNAVQNALRPFLSDDFEVIFHPHDVRLNHIPEGEKVLFMLRDPVERYISGFNSRHRRGAPRYNIAWDESETRAFTAFPTPDALATSLSSPDAATRAAGVAAMHGINHVKTSYADWLLDIEYVERRRADILWVGRTYHLTQDFAGLRQLLALPSHCQLPDDPIAAHRRLPSDPVDLSAEGAENIKSWYSADYEFLRYFFD
jgi:hypothetical protein